MKTGCSVSLRFRAPLTAAKPEFRVTFSQENKISEKIEGERVC